MRKIVIVAMMLGSSTVLHAQPSRDAAVLPRHAEDFMGVYEPPRAMPAYGEAGRSCNGGRCTLNGGPSGGPNQS